MTIQSKIVKAIHRESDVSSLQVEFACPQLITFLDYKSVIVINIQNEKDFTIELDEQIISYALHDKLLWIVLKSSKVIVVVTETGAQVRIENDSHKFCEIKVIDNKLLLISESTECFNMLYRREDIVHNTEDKFIPVYEKVYKYKNTKFRNGATLGHYQNYFNGCNLGINKGNLVLRCPLTGLSDAYSIKNHFNHAATWDSLVMLCRSSEMHLVDIVNNTVMHSFENIEGNYYPSGCFNGKFYYVTNIKSQISVYYACRQDFSGGTFSGDAEKSGNAVTNLSQEALKLKLKTFLENTSPLDTHITVIKEFFDTIEDVEYLIDAVKTIFHYSFCKSLLNLLQKRVAKLKRNDLMFEINDLIIKTDLIDYIHFKNCKDYEGINLIDKSFIQLCKLFIEKLDIDLASICWLKYSQLQVNVKSEDIIEILNAVPCNIKMSSLIMLLRKFLSTLMDIDPFFIDIFVKWAMERVFQLEKSSTWPKIGYKFVEEILVVIRLALESVPVRPISVDDLDKIKDHIKQIIELKENYKINMLISELSSQNPSEIVLIMLRRCYTEDLNGFLNSYLPSYTTRHSFELDNTLHTFIVNESACSGGSVDSLRLEILLNGFHSTTKKLECLLEVLKVLDVPWDPTVHKIAIDVVSLVYKDFTVAESDKRLAQEIEREINYANVKVILKKYNFPLNCREFKLLLHKIVNNAVVNLSDLKVILNINYSYALYGGLVYIDHCIRHCETGAALDYFNSLLSIDKRIVIKSLLTKYEEVVNGNSKCALTEKNYLDFLKGTRLLSLVESTTIENLYHLKHSYSTKVKLNDLANESFGFNIASMWISSNNDKDIVNSTGSGRCIKQLTNSQKSQNSTLISLIRYSTANYEVRHIVEFLVTSSTLICDEITRRFLQFHDGNNTNILLNCHNLIVDLISSCDEKYLSHLLKIMTVFNALTKSNITIKNLAIIWKFHYIYLPMCSESDINNLIQFYTRDVSKQFEEIVSSIWYKSELVPFRILPHLMIYVINNPNNDYIDMLHQLQCTMINNLLMKIVSLQEFDELLATGLLLLLNTMVTQTDDEWLLNAVRGEHERMSSNVTHYLSYPSIRCVFSLHNLFEKNAVSFEPQSILKRKFNLDLADIALSDISEETWDVKLILLHVLNVHSDMTIDQLSELCSSLNISMNYGFSLQLISILSTWEIKYKIKNNYMGFQQIVFENNENELLLKCIPIWESITNKEFIIDVLQDFWKNGEVTLHGRLVSVNPYYYEVYMCIYYFILKSPLKVYNLKDYYLLNYLKKYVRKSSPKQYEFDLFAVKGMFPEIGHYRLPFLLFMRDDMWANLKSEITLETYELWLPAVALLELDKDMQMSRDMICSNALKQTMTSRKKKENVNMEIKENDHWSLTSKEESLLRAAHKCVRYIANMEWAGACLFYVLQGCAPGADQVAAAQLCYQFSQRWTAIQPGNRAVRQMEKLHSTLSSRHALFKIEWACEDFIRLLPEPSQLIRAMYLHPDFIKKMIRHDVNRATNEIADKNGINISTIRIQIIENILNKQEGNRNYLEYKELLTVKYILKATCPKMAAIYLSRIAFDEDVEYNKIKKVRALQCLISIIEPETALKITNCERTSLWESLLQLIINTGLENIDMPWVIATLKEDKVRGLEQLLQTIGGNVEGLKIAAELVRRHGSDEIVCKVIPLLLRSGLYEEILRIFLKMPLLPNEVIYSAWRTIIISPFQSADFPITERQRTKCLEAVNVLPLCPIIRDEDLIEIWKHCVRCKCYGIGCLVLPFMTHQKRQSLPGLLKIDKRNLIASLKNLHSESYLVSSAMFVIDTM